MTMPVPIAVPRKGRPLDAVLERIARVTGSDGLADDVSSTLRYEKAVTKGSVETDRGPYERLEAYSDPTDPYAPEYTLFRDSRDGMPRRIVFDAVQVDVGDVTIQLIGREEPFRALRTHEFALGFDSADLVLEEVVELRPDGIEGIDDINSRINPQESDVRVVTSLGDTVYHTLMARPGLLASGRSLDRGFLAEYEGPLCISPRYERLVTAVLGTEATTDVSFRYPNPELQEEEASIAETGLGVYLTVTGSTAREHGLILGEHLFPSETVLMKNESETTARVEFVRDRLASLNATSALST